MVSTYFGPVRTFNKMSWGGVDLYFSLAEKSEDITDTVLAVRCSLQDVGDALDDFIRGAEMLAVIPGL